MKILLLGSSNVGKTTTGELLAEQLGYDFYDINDEVKKYLEITIEEFVSRGTLYERDQIRCKLIHTLVEIPGDMVIAISPISYISAIHPIFSSPDILAIELVDSVQNIFDRLIFSDENDIIYKDDDYKNQHKEHYLHEIAEDLKWYGSVYQDIAYQFNMDGRSAADVVSGLIKEYHLIGTEE